ncbi:o-succinylbenzoate synthase [Alkalihalobacillus sp. TS-13]|uniref:o-succinylbenzoate synthase n=1 Tax=Alkalihalobacillus sp. TS-13 TaxID=2842455 RepID=UPI001C867F97|nr:o-succinylbenzoate synthase [Alkalihalobacillus sp. TS-13]
MRIEKMTIHKIEMPLKRPFVTAVNTVNNRSLLIVEVESADGVVGWGECSAFDTPWYTEETTDTCLYMMKEFLIPEMLEEKEFGYPEDLSAIFSHYRGHHMAKSCLETALWDVYAKSEGRPLADVLGGRRRELEVGIAIGMQAHTDDLLFKIDEALQSGYRRIKLKVKPGEDLDMLASVRSRFPEAPLMADANSSYRLDDLERLKEIDQFNLMMIEQPLGATDFVEHAELQKVLRTPVCLDESIISFETAQTAVALGSCKIIAIKHSRVGGLMEAKRIHDYCQKHDVKVWAGGMIESGIGKVHNIALASLDGFEIPGDITASTRYWEQDIITPEIKLENGKVIVSDAPGIGYEVNRKQLERYTVEKVSFK